MYYRYLLFFGWILICCNNYNACTEVSCDDAPGWFTLNLSLKCDIDHCDPVIRLTYNDNCDPDVGYDGGLISSDDYVHVQLILVLMILVMTVTIITHVLSIIVMLNKSTNFPIIPIKCIIFLIKIIYFIFRYFSFFWKDNIF